MGHSRRRSPQGRSRKPNDRDDFSMVTMSKFWGLESILGCGRDRFEVFRGPLLGGRDSGESWPGQLRCSQPDDVSVTQDTSGGKTAPSDLRL